MFVCLSVCFKTLAGCLSETSSISGIAGTGIGTMRRVSRNSLPNYVSKSQRLSLIDISQSSFAVWSVQLIIMMFQQHNYVHGYVYVRFCSEPVGRVQAKRRWCRISWLNVKVCIESLFIPGLVVSKKLSCVNSRSAALFAKCCSWKYIEVMRAQATVLLVTINCNVIRNSYPSADKIAFVTVSLCLCKTQAMNLPLRRLILSQSSCYVDTLM